MDKSILIKFINIDTMRKLFMLFFAFASCSDKYSSVYNISPKPELILSKEVMSIRERDISNVNFTNRGRLTLYSSNVAHQLNIQFDCVSSAIHLMYRGTEIKSGQALPALDSLSLFCYADSIGVYLVNFYLVDQMGKTVQKQLIVNSLPNKPPVSTFFSIFEGQERLQNWEYYFDGSISRDTDGLVQTFHYSFDGQW